MNYATALKKAQGHTEVKDENIPATRVEQRGAEKGGELEGEGQKWRRKIFE